MSVEAMVQVVVALLLQNVRRKPRRPNLHRLSEKAEERVRSVPRHVRCAGLARRPSMDGMNACRRYWTAQRLLVEELCRCSALSTT